MSEVPKVFTVDKVPEGEDLLKVNHDAFTKLVKEIYDNDNNTPRSSIQIKQMFEDIKGLVDTFNTNNDEQYLLWSKHEWFFSNLLSDWLAYDWDIKTTNQNAKEVMETDYDNALVQLIINLESNITSLKNKSKNDRIYLAAEIAPKNILAWMNIELWEKNTSLTGDGNIKAPLNTVNISEKNKIITDEVPQNSKNEDGFFSTWREYFANNAVEKRMKNAGLN